MANGQFAGSSVALPLSAQTQSRALPDRIILGVRPEDAEVAPLDQAH